MVETLTNLEIRYRRFQDFGLIVGMVVVITVVGSAARYSIGDIGLLMIPVRTVFYAALIWNLAGLRFCLKDEARIPGFETRAGAESALGSVISIAVTVLGGLCFELT